MTELAKNIGFFALWLALSGVFASALWAVAGHVVAAGRLD